MKTIKLLDGTVWDEKELTGKNERRFFLLRRDEQDCIEQ
jgi:hypothetical protein